MALVDHLGRPLKAATLTREVAGPTVSGVRSVMGSHPEEGLTPSRLASLLRLAERGDPIAYLELAEAMEEKDLHYRAVLGTRKLAVCQLEITVESASKDRIDEENADLVREWIDRDTLDDELFDIQDGLGKSYSVSEIIWETTSERWWPASLKLRDPRWFRPDKIDGETLLLRGESGELEPLDPFKYVIHRPKTKSGLMIRGGIARAVAWLYLFKNYSIKDWVAFAELYGQPLRIGKYEDGATEENIRKLSNAVASMGSDAAAVIAKSMEIEFVDAGRGGEAGGAEVFASLVNFCDLQISKAVLGQTATTDAIAGGHAVGKEHREVQKDIARADAKQLSATLNRDLVRPMVTLNKGPQKRYPRIKLVLPEAVDIAALSDALAKTVPLGLRVDAKEVRGKFGLSDPRDDAELLSPPAAPPAPVDPLGAPTPAADPAKGLSRFSRPLKPAVNADAPPRPAADDAIDAAIARELSDWEPLIEGLTDPIRELVGGARSLEEIRAGLIARLDDMDEEPLTELLTKLGFSARLAGASGLPLGERED